jgi:hypothetical protein
MLIGKADTVIVIPMTMIAENRNDLAVLSVCVLAIFEGDILRFIPPVRAPKESVSITVPHNYSARLARPTSPAIPRKMKRAIDDMNANVALPVTVSDIAREAGTSVRALQLDSGNLKGRAL